MLGSWVNKITAQQEWPHYQNIFQTADGGRELQSNPILGVSVGEEKHNQPFKHSGAMNEQKLILILTQFQVILF